MIYFWSDPHFWHKNVIRYCDRPFEDLEQMHEGLIDNFNSVVQPEDTTYWIGDAFFCGPKKSEPIMERLNGTHILIRGNHDRAPKNMLKIGFTAVLEKAEIVIGGIRVKMCHYPYRPVTTDLPEQVREAIGKELLEQKSTGKDSSGRLDDLVKDFWNDGSITREQMKRLISYDLRFSSRRYDDDGGWLLCGHIHEKWAQMGKMINVGVDVRNFKPISIDEIRLIMDKG